MFPEAYLSLKMDANDKTLQGKRGVTSKSLVPSHLDLLEGMLFLPIFLLHAALELLLEMDGKQTNEQITNKHDIYWFQVNHSVIWGAGHVYASNV